MDTPGFYWKLVYKEVYRGWLIIHVYLTGFLFSVVSVMLQNHTGQNASTLASSIWVFCSGFFICDLFMVHNIYCTLWLHPTSQNGLTHHQRPPIPTEGWLLCPVLVQLVPEIWDHPPHFLQASHKHYLLLHPLNANECPWTLRLSNPVGRQCWMPTSTHKAREFTTMPWTWLYVFFPLLFAGSQPLCVGNVPILSKGHEVFTLLVAQPMANLSWIISKLLRMWWNTPTKTCPLRRVRRSTGRVST